ncbi:MAG: S41 family peptidase [Flavobacteriaceae bacterium]|nr:S41 family peptidase [Flavobacteriaceae bacterium]
MKKIFWPLIISISLCLGVLLGGFITSASYRTKPSVFFNPNKTKLSRLIDFIEQEYVDEVNTDSIVDLTVTSILEQLDPHSIYIAKKELKGLSESMQGSFVGIGVNYYYYKDSLAVMRAVDHGPAQRGGVLAGDRILYADGIKLFGKGITSDSISNVLRGEEGTKVKLQVYRKTANKKLDLVLTRSTIPLQSVDIALKLEDGNGYIKINRFSSTTYEEFKLALDSLLMLKINGLIIDLRDNGGGYMDQSNKMLNELLDKGQVIVKTINKKGKENVLKVSSTGAYRTGDLYILVNENSASASEIIAGAIQDNDRGTVVGRRTFGKGLVQRELMLGDGSAIRLTTARYYTPSGRSIQKPYNNGIGEYNNDFVTRYERGELYAKDSIKLADSLQFKTLKGRTVYGGGGIVPDLFVPISSKHGDDAIILLMQSGMVSYFVFEEIDRNRKFFESKSNEQLISYLQKDQKVYQDFVKHLQEGKLFFKLDKRKQLVNHYLIAEFIRQLQGEKQSYEWLLSNDEMIKAIDIAKLKKK